MIAKFHHIALIVESLDKAIPQLETLGAKFVSKDASQAEGRTSAHLQLGGIEIVLMEPLGEGGEVARLLKARGEGVHSLSFEVDNLETVLETLTSKGIRVVYKGSALGYNFSFTHPKDCCGVMFELVERAG